MTAAFRASILLLSLWARAALAGESEAAPPASYCTDDTYELKGQYTHALNSTGQGVPWVRMARDRLESNGTLSYHITKADDGSGCTITYQDASPPEEIGSTWSNVMYNASDLGIESSYMMGVDVVMKKPKLSGEDNEKGSAGLVPWAAGEMGPSSIEMVGFTYSAFAAQQLVEADVLGPQKGQSYHVPEVYTYGPYHHSDKFLLQEGEDLCNYRLTGERLRLEVYVNGSDFTFKSYRGLYRLNLPEVTHGMPPTYIGFQANNVASVELSNIEIRAWDPVAEPLEEEEENKPQTGCASKRTKALRHPTL